MTAAAINFEIDDPVSPPRSNGELVFAEPWESRAFGMAMALHSRGAFTWDEFRDSLVVRIKQWEAQQPSGECWSYYRCWEQALEDMVVGLDLLADGNVTERAIELAARPAGHDHDHEHDHHD